MEKVNAYDASTCESNAQNGQAKAITPAVLGVPSSHGVKLSMSMTSKDKRELLSRLEEWRKARREKLAASILAKKKPLEKTKIVPAFSSTANVRASAFETVDGKDGNKENVFERLYKDSKKVKKPEIKGCQFKPSQPVKSAQVLKKKPVVVNLEKSYKPTDVPRIEKNRNPNDYTMPEVTGEKVEKSFSLPQTQIIPQQNEQLIQSAEEKSAETKSKLDSDETSFENKLTLCSLESLNGMTATTEKDLGSNEISESTVEEKTSNEKKTEDPVLMENLEIKSACTESIPEENFPLISDSELSKKDASPKNTNVDKFQKPCLPNSKNVTRKVLKKDSETTKPKTSIRRSLSMLYRNRGKLSGVSMKKATSEKNLHELKPDNEYTKEPSSLQPLLPDNRVAQEKTNKVDVEAVSFVTPKSNKMLNSCDMRNKLEDWLKDNGHPLNGYSHLRGFDETHTHEAITQAPENTDTPKESLNVKTPNTPVDDSDKENVTPATVIQRADKNLAENWLKELYRLIVELKYPADRCEEWVAAIRRKCPSCTQLHIYWECLAALEEAKGDMKFAVEYYKKAIVKGAEVDSVGESLAHLFDKMLIDDQKTKKAKLEKGLDLKNIFKSTVIKFALLQKAFTELESTEGKEKLKQLYIATPVRRSSRIQGSCNSNVVSSLQTLTPELRENIKFKPNKSLFNRE